MVHKPWFLFFSREEQHLDEERGGILLLLLTSVAPALPYLPAS